MFFLPLWEPKLELIISMGTFGWNFFLLFIIATSNLHCVIRALLCSNAMAVLLVSLAQFLLSVWCIQSGRLIGESEFHFFLPILLYQSGYYMCACSYLLITVERLILCYKPSIYERNDVSFSKAITLSFVIEILIIPSKLYFDIVGSFNVFCASFIGLQECVTFAVKCVIELTRAFIPIIASALCVKLTMFTLTILSKKVENFAADAHFLLRMACTLYSIFMPFLLIFQVKSLRRRFTTFFPSATISPETIQEDAQSATKKYFDE
ncbi:hypothetical protein PMAYCL1PPCAC_17267, partial [Pristionchus mayeri]